MISVAQHDDQYRYFYRHCLEISTLKDPLYTGIIQIISSVINGAKPDESLMMDTIIFT